MALIRGAIMLLAVMFQSGVIPTGIEGGGQRVSDALMVIAVTIAAGDKTSEATKEVTADVKEAQAEGRL